MTEPEASPRSFRESDRFLILLGARGGRAAVGRALGALPWSRLEAAIQVLVVDPEVGAAAPPSLPAVAPERVTWLTCPVDPGPGGRKKLGYRFALDAGYAAVADVDARDPAAGRAVEALLAAWRAEPADLTLGVEPEGSKRLGGGWGRRLWNRSWGRLTARLTGGSLRGHLSLHRLVATRFLDRVPFEINSNGPRFDVELLNQALGAETGIREVEVSAEPDGPAPAVGSWRSAPRALGAAIQFRAHQMGMLCSLKYQGIGPVGYRDKTEGLYNSHAAALQVVAAQRPARVLDLGCGPGFVARECEALGAAVTGVDLADPVAGSMTEFHAADLELESLPVDPFQYDLILLLDFLEHLSRPEQFLLELRRRSRAERAIEDPPLLVVTTPNVAFLTVRLGLLLGRFNYAERGILDITHKRLFTRSSLRRALEDCGYSIEALRPIGPPFELVVGGRLGRLLGALGQALARIWPTVGAFQFLVLCRPLPGSHQLLRRAARGATQEG